MTPSGFLAVHGRELLVAVAEHIGLVAVAAGAAAAIGIPLGILLTRRPALVKPVMGATNVAQTIPSLALFAVLIPLHVSILGVRVLGGIGAGSAIAALVIYALLPIVRNTYAGITGVDASVREAGRAMGMTDRQLLWRVELPLALPTIVAGLRVATVLTVGTATIAAAIDAGGLGKFIFRGLRMDDDVLLLAGAVPAALVAIGADLLLGALERRLANLEGLRRERRPVLGVALAALLVAAGLASWRPWAAPEAQRPVVVGAKDFTEQLLLGELVAQTIHGRTGLPVTRRFDLGGNLAHRALLAGEIDVYAEYTGTALVALLKEPPLTDAAAVLAKVRNDYDHRFGLTLTTPLGFANTFAILVRGEDARTRHLRTISDLVPLAPTMRAGLGQDFLARPDGYRAWTQAYGIRFGGPPREMELALTYRALRDKQVDVIVANSTNGLIDRYGFVQLEDDRHFFPPYDAVPVARSALLHDRPAVKAALEALGGVLDLTTMRRLNQAVDADHRLPRQVVAEFLAMRGLVATPPPS